jgi:hypothetical protein
MIRRYLDAAPIVDFEDQTAILKGRALGDGTAPDTQDGRQREPVISPWIQRMMLTGRQNQQELAFNGELDTVLQ